jgi:hypothetical protein
MGFFVVSRATEVPERATSQLCSDFPENANYMFLKIRVKLSGRSTVTVETCTKCQKRDMKILCEGIGHILRSLEWRCQNREKSTILGHFLGGFWDFQRRKRVPRWKIWKKFIYSHFVYSSSQTKLVLVKFFHKCTVWEIASLAKNSKFGKKG